MKSDWAAMVTNPHSARDHARSEVFDIGVKGR